MARLYLPLLGLLLLLVSALFTVTAQHQARKLNATLEREQNRMRDLEVEWGQLQIEQSTWAAHKRLLKIANERIAMQTPERTNTWILDTPTVNNRASKKQ